MDYPRARHGRAVAGVELADPANSRGVDHEEDGTVGGLRARHVVVERLARVARAERAALQRVGWVVLVRVGDECVGRDVGCAHVARQS